MVVHLFPEAEQRYSVPVHLFPEAPQRYSMSVSLFPDAVQRYSMVVHLLHGPGVTLLCIRSPVPRGSALLLWVE
jgi:hypothetical protein